MRALRSPCEVLPMRRFLKAIATFCHDRRRIGRLGVAVHAAQETVWYRLIVIVVRCTAKLLERFRAHADPQDGLSTSRLGDWYATLIRTRRGHFVLAMARETLLPVEARLVVDTGSAATTLLAPSMQLASLDGGLSA
jgi:uncharacterized protein DUF6933